MFKAARMITDEELDIGFRRVRQCVVGGLPGSGTPDELVEAAGISASRIAAAARHSQKPEKAEEGGT
jgi:hypothetical protein